MADPKEHIGAQYIIEISCDISFFALSLNGEESLRKLNNSRIQIRIFTKIKSICHGHTPNLSTKFHPNPSPTFWDIVLYISWAESFNDKESLKKNYQIRIRIPIFTKMNQLFLVKHPTCPPSFVRICPQLFEISCYIWFLARSLNGEASLKKF